MCCTSAPQGHTRHAAERQRVIATVEWAGATRRCCRRFSRPRVASCPPAASIPWTPSANSDLRKAWYSATLHLNPHPESDPFNQMSLFSRACAAHTPPASLRRLRPQTPAYLLNASLPKPGVDNTAVGVMPQARSPDTQACTLQPGVDSVAVDALQPPALVQRRQVESFYAASLRV